MSRLYRSQRMLGLRLMLLAAGSAGTALLGAFGHWRLCVLVSLLLTVLYVYTLRRQRRIIERMTFMFDSVENDDYSFRFGTDPRRSDDVLLNAALNRAKELMLRVKSEAAEKERYYELIMDNVRQGIITLGANGIIWQANREALRIFGLPRLSHIGQLSIVAPEAAQAVSSMESGDSRHITYMGECGPVSLSLDCTEASIGEQRVRIVAVGDLGGAMDETEAESWSKLTRMLTHEIMNSLAPVTSLSDTLTAVHGRTDDPLGRGLQTIADTSRRLAAFVESFRRFTRIPQPSKAVEEIAPLIGRAADIVGSGCGVPVRCTFARPELMVWADAGQISHVLVNLIKNAAEAVQDIPGGAVEVECYEDGDQCVVVTVSDNGPAIPAEAVDNIFTPFFTTKPGGSGVGLSVSRRIVQLHGGSLRLLRNSPGRVTFGLRLH